MISCQSIRKSRKGPKRYKVSRTKEKLQKENAAPQEEMKKIAEENARNEQRFLFFVGQNR